MWSDCHLLRQSSGGHGCSGVNSVCTAVYVIVYGSVCKTHASLCNNQRDPVTLPFLRSVGYVYIFSDFSLRSEEDPFITYNYLMTLTLRHSQVSVKRNKKFSFHFRRLPFSRFEDCMAIIVDYIGKVTRKLIVRLTCTGGR